MTRKDFEKVCKLNMVWYFYQIYEDLDIAFERGEDELKQTSFEDGRFEFLESEFKKESGELVREDWFEICKLLMVWYYLQLGFDREGAEERAEQFCDLSEEKIDFFDEYFKK